MELGESDPKPEIRSSVPLRFLTFQWVIMPPLGDIGASSTIASAFRHFFPLLWLRDEISAVWRASLDMVGYSWSEHPNTVPIRPIRLVIVIGGSAGRTFGLVSPVIWGSAARLDLSSIFGGHPGQAKLLYLEVLNMQS